MSSIVLNFSRIIDSDINFKLSGSKSISQRSLIINNLIRSINNEQNLSKSDDTNILKNCLNSKDEIKNVINSGTSLRFLISFYALSKKSVIITGDEYLFNRPINMLISYLNSLGAKIIKNRNKILIDSAEIKGGEINIKFAYTSQFFSSLLLISPYLKGGVKFYTKKSMLSQSYINMTLAMMQKCGIKIEQNNNTIIIPQSKYSKAYGFIESDWTSASYLYLAFLFSNLNSVTISILHKNSMQPDSNLISFFKFLGVNSKFFNNSVVLSKSKSSILPEKLEWNFINNPDFALTAFIACLGLNIKLNALGLDTLPYKESDRINSLCLEISKFQCSVEVENNNKIIMKPKKLCITKNVIDIDTHNDHRIALCFSPLALLGYRLRINNPDVINKSYPDFYNDLSKFGIIIN